MRLPSRVALVSSLVFLGCPPAEQNVPLVMTVTPATVELSQGETANLMVTLKQGSRGLSVAGTTWTSSATSVASVAGNADGSATVTAVSPGSATLTARNGSSLATVEVVVQATIVTRLELTPAGASLAKGTTLKLTAMAVFTNNSTLDFSTDVDWSSSDEGVLTVDATGRVTGIAVGTATVTASLQGLTATLLVTVTDATLSRLELTPVAPMLAAGTTVQLTATGVFSDSSTQDLTAQVTWVAPGSAVLTLSTSGLVTGVVPGSASVSASLGSVTASLTITVTSATLSAITLSPADPSVARGASVQLTATGHFTNQSTQDLTSQVTWASGGADVSVSSTGEARGEASGSATITATLDGVTGSTTVTVTDAELVTLTVSPSTNVSVPRGMTQAFTVDGEYTDGTHADLTTQATWSSSAPTTANISNAPGSRGLLTALEVGTTTVQAALGTVTSAGVTVTVADPLLLSITVTPTGPLAVAKGRTQQLTATGLYSDGSTPNLTTLVTWASDNVAAPVSNAAGNKGLVTALSLGSATVTATLSAFPSVTGSVAVTVTAPELMSISVAPSPITVLYGATQQLTATGILSDVTFDDLTTLATWTVTDPAIASVDAAGVLHALAAGTTTVRASRSGVDSALVTVTVTRALEEVLVSSVDGGALTLAKGRTLELKATARYSDTSLEVVTATWASDDAGVATVNDGLVFGAGVGTANISATVDGVTGAAAVTVTPAVVETLSLADLSVPRGATRLLALTGALTDGTPIDPATVTWGSDDQTTVTVDTVGIAHVLNTATLGATVQVSATRDGVTATALVTVAPAEVTALSIDDAPGIPVPHGSTWPLSATASFSDGTTGPVTTGLVWSSSAPSVVSVDAAGVLRAEVASGTANISVSTGGVSSSAVTVTAGPAVMVGLTASVPSSVRQNVVARATALAHYSDGTSVDVTSLVTWASAGAASVSNVIGASGTLIPSSVGTALVSATGSGFSADAGQVSIIEVVSSTQDAGAVGHLVISQMYGGGGNVGSTYRNDFIELYNPTSSPISVAGWSVQYAAATSGTWAVTPLTGSVEPGGYLLVQEGAGSGGTTNLPTPEVVGTISMGATGGKVALVSGTTALTGACPTTGVIDFVSAAGSSPCTEGVATAAPSAVNGASRKARGCQDSNSSVDDFSLVAAAPRNSASPRVACDYAANELDLPEEADYCNVQFPTVLNIAAGALSDTIYGRLFEAGVTETNGAPAGATMQFGFGAASSDPRLGGWQWWPASFNVQVGNDDEFQAAFIAPATGTYRYAARVSLDGGAWTYCDVNGAGSNGGLVFEPTQLGALTVP